MATLGRMDITLAYSETEDRVWLRSQGQMLWLTRRILVRFLSASGKLLEQSVPGGEVPNALPPSHRIQIDHEEALAETPEGSAALKHGKEAPPAAEDAQAVPLVHTIHITPSQSLWVLTLKSSEVEMQVRLNRRDFHRLLGAMFMAAKRGEWLLAPLPEWMNLST